MHVPELKIKPTQRLNPFLAFAVFVMCFGAFCLGNVRAQEFAKSEVAGLLEQLDSQRFRDRESATEKLVGLGPEILKPAVAHFFDASSEAGWRIRQILEDVGKNGSEQDFLKSIAITQVLYGDHESDAPQRLAKLQYQWKEARRQEASKQLAKLGFKFDSQQAGYQRPEAGLRFELQDFALQRRRIEGNGIDQRGNRPQLDQAETDVATTKWQNPRTDRQAAMHTISEIIDGSAETNRDIAEKLLPISKSINLPQGTLEIPADWKSDERTRKLIDNLGPLSDLKLRQQKVDANLQRFIGKQIGLKSLQLIDCEFDEKLKSLALPASIYQYEIAGKLPPSELLESLGSISTLILRRCEVTKEIAEVLSGREIKIIQLEEVTFDRASIQQLLNTRNLLRVRMSLCDFKLEWLEESRRKNPNLISAVPQAFLGVQGGLDVSGGDFPGCQISQVVAGTAAAESGMESLDVVTEASGQKIVRFEDLRLLISQKRPGETLPVKVRRGDKELDLTIKLGNMNGVAR